MIPTLPLRRHLAVILLPIFLASAAFAQEASKTQFRVMYLQHADVIEATNMLDQLLEGELGPATIRIIPEHRTNALFVTAPETVMKEVEQFLKILDADVPGSINHIKIFALKNLDADSAQDVVSKLIGNDVRISADAKTNSLIVTGKEGDVAVVEAILLKLDESNARSQKKYVITYELAHIPAQEAADNLMTLGAEANVAVDKTANRLLVSCDAARHEVVENILKTIDVPEEKAVLGPVQLRLVWLVEEKLAGENAAAPAGNLEKPLKVLEDRMGLTNLKTAAQFVVSLEPDSNAKDGGRPFTARGTTEFKDEMLAELEFEGVLTGESAGRPVIEVSIDAHLAQTVVMSGGRGAVGGQLPPRSRSSSELAGLNTKVAAPFGHSVVLGVTSIRSAASVFILQVLPADAE